MTNLDTACATEHAIDEYLSDYTMDGDDTFHLPTESELALIKDAIMGLLVDQNFLASFTPLTEPELRAGIALQLREIERLRVQVKQADERGDEAMRRAHNAENELAEAKSVIAAMKDDYNRKPENEPIGMLLNVLSTRARNIVNFELSIHFPGEVLTLGHLCRFARSEVFKFPNCGKKTVREIEEYMRPRGVWWRGEA